METEIERRAESEPSGSSVLCVSTAVVGSVGGLRGTVRSVQLSGETAAQEQWCRGGTGSVGKQRGQQEAAGNKQYAAAVSVAPVAVAVRAALTVDTVATEDLTAHWVTLVWIWAGSVPACAAVRWEVAVAMVAYQ
jgi:hypothetical protein